ncbi:DUF3836 domain-containing protein [uncultured Bacteroides sp.]|uniref:DUF3836 domain-containing protein n=1 Tax=uncultured Bacteroides sp. TaxID=162156 RepID=UPI002AAC1B51|nr:DUF3836 domain-containing protein [uncultured Bacteroides sp.]
MKKIALSISTLVISITLVLLFVCGSAVNAQKSKSFVYDKSKDIVFLYDSTLCTLTPHRKYELSYNENGQLIRKMAYRWDTSKNEWTPYYSYTIVHIGESQIQEFGRWNKKKNDFSLNKQKSIYHKDAGSDVSNYIAFKWCERRGKWEVEDGGLFDAEIALLADNSTK